MTAAAGVASRVRRPAPRRSPCAGREWLGGVVRSPARERALTVEMWVEGFFHALAREAPRFNVPDRIFPFACTPSSPLSALPIWCVRATSPHRNSIATVGDSYEHHPPASISLATAAAPASTR